MLAGHIAVGLIGKRIAPRVSLGTLVFAAVGADLLWCLLLIIRVEHIKIRAGHTTQDSLEAIDIVYSHSLLMDAVWAGMFAAAYWVRRRYPRGAWVLFGALLSHWLLDFVSHRPDMPLAPGLPGRLGLGVWDSLPATLVIEGGLWLAAILLYTRTTHPKTRTGTYAWWGGVILLTAIWWNNVAGPPPPSNAVALGISSFIFFSLVTLWAYWINRLRADVKMES